MKLRDNLELGVATASAQIEGGIENSNWYEFSKIPGVIKDGSNPLRANKHYELYKEDIELMKKMKIEIYRLSVEWSRIEPEDGVFDEKVLEHYRDELKLLNKNGIKPLVTLHHFSHPMWFEKLGGFTTKKSVFYFTRYTQKVVEAFKGLCNEYCTINEPNIYASSSFLFGSWYPMKKSAGLCTHVLQNMARCHIASYKAIKAIDSNIRVGFAMHLVNFEPERKHNLLDRFTSKFLFEKFFQMSICKAMCWGKFTIPLGFIGIKKGNYADFFGINYYLRNMVHGFGYHTKEGVPTNNLGWELYPQGIKNMSEKYYKIFKKEIYITENGTCDAKDEFRQQYIHDHLAMVNELPYVTRYYHWTFIDNWEWAEGESAKFGLVELNFETQERTIRPSGKYFTKVIETREL